MDIPSFKGSSSAVGGASTISLIASILKKSRANNKKDLRSVLLIPPIGLISALEQSYLKTSYSHFIVMHLYQKRQLILGKISS